MKQRATIGNSQLFINDPIFSPILVLENKLLIQYAKNMVADTGTIDLTEVPAVFIISLNEIFFCFLDIRSATAAVRPGVNISRLLDNFAAPAPSRAVKNVLFRK
jgi:hypothetical protein